MFTRVKWLHFKKKDVKSGLKDVSLISSLRVVNPGLKPKKNRGLTFGDRFFSTIKQVSYHKINQAVFDNKLIKQVRSVTRE